MYTWPGQLGEHILVLAGTMERRWINYVSAGVVDKQTVGLAVGRFIAPPLQQYLRPADHRASAPRPVHPCWRNWSRMLSAVSRHHLLCLSPSAAAIKSVVSARTGLPRPRHDARRDSTNALIAAVDDARPLRRCRRPPASAVSRRSGSENKFCKFPMFTCSGGKKT
jgi:hypothetical protein